MRLQIYFGNLEKFPKSINIRCIDLSFLHGDSRVISRKKPLEEYKIDKELFPITGKKIFKKFDMNQRKTVGLMLLIST